MHSPIRSESDVFSAVVLIVAGAGVAVGLGAIFEPWIGAVVGGLLVGIAIGMTLRAARGSIPEDVVVASGAPGAHRILILANRTVEGEALLSEVRNRAAGHDQVELLVVSPSTPGSRLQLITSDTDEAREQARERLERSLRSLRGAGFRASGSTGDEDPVVAARDALREFGADEVIVSTLPPSESKWIERGVVEQLREQTSLPVSHVVGAAAREAVPA